MKERKKMYLKASEAVSQIMENTPALDKEKNINALLSLFVMGWEAALQEEKIN